MTRHSTLRDLATFIAALWRRDIDVLFPLIPFGVCCAIFGIAVSRIIVQDFGGTFFACIPLIVFFHAWRSMWRICRSHSEME
jgi:uncharacterized membrane protein YfcA